ncbi:MAG: GNAT family N-acetyltransferase [Acidobacteriaceae bacterium]
MFQAEMAAERATGAGDCTVRPARLEDLDHLVALDAACFPSGIAYPRRYLHALLCSPTCIAQVATLPTQTDAASFGGPQAAVSGTGGDGGIVGFAILELRRHARTLVGELVTLDVQASARRCGVGQRLHGSLEQIVRQHNGHRMRLQVSVENAPAIRLYQRLGYHIYGRIPRYYLGKIDAWWMEKRWELVQA